MHSPTKLQLCMHGCPIVPCHTGSDKWSPAGHVDCRCLQYLPPLWCQHLLSCLSVHPGPSLMPLLLPCAACLPLLLPLQHDGCMFKSPRQVPYSVYHMLKMLCMSRYGSPGVVCLTEACATGRAVCGANTTAGLPRACPLMLELCLQTQDMCRISRYHRCMACPVLPAQSVGLPPLALSVTLCCCVISFFTFSRSDFHCALLAWDWLTYLSRDLAPAA